MANKNWPRGLMPVQAPGKDTPIMHYYKVTSTLTAAIGIGSPMIMQSTGFVRCMNHTTANVQTLLVGASAEYRAAAEGKTRYIGIWDDPDQLFIIQSGMTTAASNAIASVGASARMKTYNGVNVTTGYSKCVLDGVGTTSLAPMKIVGIDRRIDNETGSYIRFLVKLQQNVHHLAGEAGV